MEQQSKKTFLINFSYIVIISFLIILIGKFTLSYLTPFVLAVLIAYFMQKPAGFLSKKTGIKKGRIASVLAAGIYLIIALLLLLLIYRIIIAISDLAGEMPLLFSYITKLFSRLEKSFKPFFEGLSPGMSAEIIAVFRETLENLAVRITNSFSVFAADAAKATPSFLFSSIVALVASCYIAKDFDGLKNFFSSLCGEKVYSNIIKIKKIFSESVLKLLKGYLILTLITYAELLIGFLILRVKYAPLIALLVAFIDLLPVLGTGTVLIPWGLILISLGNTFSGFALLVLYILVILVRNFSEPKIIGKQMGINPLFTLVAMFIGLKLLGFWGLLLFPIILIVIIKYYKDEIENE